MCMCLSVCLSLSLFLSLSLSLTGVRVGGGIFGGCNFAEEASRAVAILWQVSAINVLLISRTRGFFSGAFPPVAPDHKSTTCPVPSAAYSDPARRTPPAGAQEGLF